MLSCSGEKGSRSSFERKQSGVPGRLNKGERCAYYSSLL